MILTEITNIQRKYIAVNGVYEPGQMVHQIDHPAAGDNAQAVALPELHCA